MPSCLPRPAVRHHARRVPVLVTVCLLACSGGSDTTSPAPSPAPPPPPPPAAVATVTVTPATTPLVSGQTVALIATVRDGAGNTLSDRSVTWSSNTPQVATVDAAGRVTAAAPGAAVITATSEGRQGTASVSVQEGGVIGAAGGTISAGDGAFQLVVPAGAITSPTAISVGRAAAPPAHPGLVSGTGWDVGPVGVSFAVPATVTVRYDATATPAASSAAASPLLWSVRQRSGTSWDLLPGGELRVAQRTISAALSRSGTVAIVAPATFDVMSGTFDTGTQGWTASGGETVGASAAAARSGSSGLSVSNRTAAWQGAGFNVLNLAPPGVFFTYSVWLRTAPGEPDASLALTMEWRAPGTTSRFEPVTRATRVTAAGWTRLDAIYALPATATFARLKVESAAGTASYYLDDFSLTRAETPVQENIPALKSVVAPHFKLGTMMHPDMVNTAHRDLSLRHFNSITPGNHLKWEFVQPVEGQFDFTGADRLIQFAGEHGLQVRGHTFVWHLQTPDWVFRDAQGQPLTASPAHKALLLARMEQHIRTVARRYGNKIAVWDVVNEVIDETQPDGLRRSPWYTVIGPEYIARAFHIAREELPNAKLVINDYPTEQPARRDALYRLVAQLKADGVPVDGVGHQMHNTLARPTLAQIEAMLQRFIPLGVDQEITELDITLYDDLTSIWPTAPAERLIRQGELYRDVFNVLRRYSSHISTVTLWGPSDDRTWLNFFFTVRTDWPLLFDRQLQAKPAYWGIVDPQFVTAAPLWARSRTGGARE